MSSDSRDVIRSRPSLTLYVNVKTMLRGRFQSRDSPLQVSVGRVRLEARVLDRPAAGEMIEVLEAVRLHTEQVVKGIVEVTADAGAAHPRGLGFQVKHLPEHAGFPEQPPVPPGAVGSNRVTEFGDHAQTERAVGGDLLMTAHLAGSLPEVRPRQTEEA